MTASGQEDSNTDVAEQNDSGTIGARLRRAREARDKSAADIAASLRLDTEKIVALENDSAPDDAFTRGYVRAYARLLDIDPASLLGEDGPQNQTQNQQPGSPESGGLRSYRPIRQAGSNDRLMRAASWLIGAVLIGLLVVWGFTHRESILSVFPTGEQDPGMQVDPPPPRLDYVYPIIEHPQQLPPVEITDALMDDIEPPPLPSSEGEPEPDQAAADTPATQAAITLQPAGESWIEVYDADGERAYLGLAKAGSNIEISGKKPLRFKIGNSTKVTLLVDGQAVNFDAFSNEGVARFILGADGPEAPPAQ